MLKAFSVSLLSLALLAFPLSAFAQFETAIGSSSFTKQQFSCVTYPGGENITVSAKGKSHSIDKSTAKKMVKNSLKKALRKINDTRDELIAAKQLLKKLLKSPTIVLPSVSQKLQQTKKRIENLEKKLETLKGQKDELKNLTQAIENCGKIPTLTNGSNILKTGTIDLPISGWQGYLMSAMHVFAWHPSLPDRICVSINGGPKVLVGVRQTSCTQFNDGPGTGHPVSYCLPNLGANQRAIIIGGRANYFHLGSYSDDLEIVQGLLSTQVDISLPSANNPCLR